VVLDWLRRKGRTMKDVRYHRVTVDTSRVKWNGNDRIVVPGPVVSIEVTIDESDIVQYVATRAARSKTGRAIALGGMVKAKRVKS
jgi:ribosomal protein L18E